MTIPFLDLRAAVDELRPALDAAWARVRDSGWFVLGREVAAFEAEFAAFCGTGHCAGCGNGLEALRLALAAAGVGPGDEVLVPANTFIATWFAVSHAGAVPVPVEPREDTANLDPDLLEAALTPRTRAVIPVHLHGQPADMDPILDFAARHELFVLEDAAQAHGARYKGKICGSLGQAAGFSFYPGKNLGALGDGGAVTSRDPELVRNVRLLGNNGSATKYVHERLGTNSRLDELQAAFLRERLRVLEDWNARRRTLAALYLKELADTGLGLPRVPEWAEPVWHLFVVRTRDRGQRDGLQAHLAGQGIGTLIHYPVPPHLSGAYADMGLPEGRLPIAERLARTSLSLPLWPQMAPEQVLAVCRAVKDFLARG